MLALCEDAKTAVTTTANGDRTVVDATLGINIQTAVSCYLREFRQVGESGTYFM